MAKNEKTLKIYNEFIEFTKEFDPIVTIFGICLEDKEHVFNVKFRPGMSDKDFDNAFGFFIMKIESMASRLKILVGKKKTLKILLQIMKGL